MRRARSVTGPLRRAHPASGATWNVQVVRGKMSSTCLWHACRALSAGLLLMLLGSAMAVIGYYADTLSVDQEVRGNATVSVKDEARGFHLNNLSYAGPIVMGFGGFIVVAACVMTFEARDSAAKVTPARPQTLPRPIPRRGPQCAPARLDQLGVYRLPHVLPLPHILPIAPLHRYRPPPVRITGAKAKGTARFGSAPDLRSAGARATLPVAMLRRPLRRYALSVDEPPQSAISASAVESECGSQSSLAMDLHGSGACAGVTLRVRDNTRRRPLARQQRLRDDTVLATPIGSTSNLNAEDIAKRGEKYEGAHLSVDNELRASSAPPATRVSPQPSPTLTVTSPLDPENAETRIFIHLAEKGVDPQTNGQSIDNKIHNLPTVPPIQVILDIEELEEDKIDMELDMEESSEDSERVQVVTRILSEIDEVKTVDQFSSKSLAQELEDAIERTAEINEDNNINAQLETNIQRLEEIPVLGDTEQIIDDNESDRVSLHLGQAANELAERNTDSEIDSVINDPLQSPDI